MGLGLIGYGTDILTLSITSFGLSKLYSFSLAKFIFGVLVSASVLL
jgi:hypothetical protein